MEHNVKFADSWQTLAYKDPEAYQLILRNTPKGRQYQQQQRQSYQQRQLRLSGDRQMIDAPRLRLGWDGYEVRHNTAGAPVSKYKGSINPYYNRSISAPGQQAMPGQARWEDLPSTRMMMAANRMPGGETPDIKKMSPESQRKWDTQAGRSYLAVKNRSDAAAASRQRAAQARQMRGAESAAYDEIVKRLTARAGRDGGVADPTAIAERARRLAPMVARNYRRGADGRWSAVSEQAKADSHGFARGIAGVTAPVSRPAVAQQTPQAQAQDAKPAASPVTVPAAPVAPVKKASYGRKHKETDMNNSVKEAYAKGFCKVAEEIGYEPSALYKFARATPMTDALGAVFGGMLPLGGVAGGIGAISGGFTNDFGKHDENEAMAFVPGVGAYRLARRINSQVNREQMEANDLGRDKVKPARHAVAEKIGPIASMALSTLLGAGIGRLVNKKKGARIGAKIGLGAGGIASLIGMIAAAKKRRRTKEEQFDADEESVLPKYLVPGVALYGMSKRLGRSQGDRDDMEKSEKPRK